MLFTKNKKGISLIILVVTIIIMVILASIVILNLTENNPINEAKLSKLAKLKENIEANVKLYASKNLTNTAGKMKPEMTFTGENELGKAVSDIDATLTSLIICNNNDKVVIVNGNEKTVIYLLDKGKYITEFDNNLSGVSSSDKWYVDKTGNVYLVLEKTDSLPIYLKNAIKNDNNLIDFIYYVNGTDSENNLDSVEPISLLN